MWSPRLTEATQVVPSEGPMYLRHGFRQPNFVPKFRASVMGVGPYAPRGDEGRHAGSSCPTGGCGESPRLPWVAAHSGAFAPAVARKWAGNGAEITPKVSSNLGQSLSHGCAVPALFTQGSIALRGMGDVDCRVGPAGFLAMTTVFCHSEERSGVGIRPFFDGRGKGVRAAEVVGPYGRSAEVSATGRCGHRPLRVVAESCRECQGSALSAEKGAGQIRPLPDTLRVQHGVLCPEVSARPRPCLR